LILHVIACCTLRRSVGVRAKPFRRALSRPSASALPVVVIPYPSPSCECVDGAMCRLNKMFALRGGPLPPENVLVDIVVRVKDSRAHTHSRTCPAWIPVQILVRQFAVRPVETGHQSPVVRVPGHPGHHPSPHLPSWQQQLSRQPRRRLRGMSPYHCQGCHHQSQPPAVVALPIYQGQCPSNCPFQQ
jgi:hypothetical protein